MSFMIQHIFFIFFYFFSIFVFIVFAKGKVFTYQVGVWLRFLLEILQVIKCVQRPYPEFMAWLLKIKINSGAADGCTDMYYITQIRKWRYGASTRRRLSVPSSLSVGRRLRSPSLSGFLSRLLSLCRCPYRSSYLLASRPSSPRRSLSLSLWRG